MRSTEMTFSTLCSYNVSLMQKSQGTPWLVSGQHWGTTAFKYRTHWKFRIICRHDPMLTWSQTHTQQWILWLYSPLGSFKWFLEMCGEAECAIAAAVTSTIHKCTKFTWVLLKWMVTPLLEIEMGQFRNTVFVRFGLHSWLKGRSKHGLPHHTKFPFSCSDLI